jgi:hypothetical protein
MPDNMARTRQYFYVADGRGQSFPLRLQPDLDQAADGFGTIQFHILSAIHSSTDCISYSVHCGFGLAASRPIHSDCRVEVLEFDTGIGG